MSELGAARWVDTLLNDYWDRLQDAGVPYEDLPEPGNFVFTVNQASLPGMAPARVDKPTKRLSFKEFGCGHYGCVMPTIDNPDVVVKLTSDATEAMFVGHLLTDTRQPDDGLVRYDRILALPSVEKRYGRPLYLIWREEAQFVGELMPGYGGVVRGLPEHKGQAIQRGVKYHRVFSEAAGYLKVRMERVAKKLSGSKELYTDDPAMLDFYAKFWEGYQSERYYRNVHDLHDGDGWRWLFDTRGMFGYLPNVAAFLDRAPDVFTRMQYALDLCAQAATELNNIDQWYTIGTAFSQMLEEGFLLADVHFGNLGLNMDGAMTVTDPGHVVPLNPEHAQIPRIEAV